MGSVYVLELGGGLVFCSLIRDWSRSLATARRVYNKPSPIVAPRLHATFLIVSVSASPPFRFGSAAGCRIRRRSCRKPSSERWVGQVAAGDGGGTAPICRPRSALSSPRVQIPSSSCICPPSWLGFCISHQRLVHQVVVDDDRGAATTVVEGIPFLRRVY